MAKKTPRRLYVVEREYATTDMNGKGGVQWAEGAVVELSDVDARWMNQHHPGTLTQTGEDDG